MGPTRWGLPGAASSFLDFRKYTESNIFRVISQNLRREAPLEIFWYMGIIGNPPDKKYAGIPNLLVAQFLTEFSIESAALRAEFRALCELQVARGAQRTASTMAYVCVSSTAGFLGGTHQTIRYVAGMRSPAPCVCDHIFPSALHATTKVCYPRKKATTQTREEE